MKRYIYKIVFFASVITAFVSCEVREFDDLNNAEVTGFEENLTRGDLQDLVAGILYSSRVRLENYFDDCGVIGREYYRLSSSEPRFTSELLGKGNAVLDNNTFYLTGPWGARYRSVKNANLILGFMEGQDLSAQFTMAEINGAKGFLKTFIAYELLLNLNLTYENGIRVDVADENNLGPFVSKNAALTAISTLLQEAANDLIAGGDEFPFSLSSGFNGFNTPSSFLQVNKAISARVAAYQGDYPAVLTFLEDSFFSLDGTALQVGVFYNFTLDQTDFVNPLYLSTEGLTSSNSRIVQPAFIADMETGDARADKVFKLPEPLGLDGLEGDYALNRYKTLTDDIPIIRNEELILLYAEANININPGETVSAINVIRNSAGLGSYTGPTDPASLEVEMLRQRRYSLFAEGHRWIDMRRFNRLDELPIDRPEDDVFTQFPIPLTENQ